MVSTHLLLAIDIDLSRQNQIRSLYLLYIPPPVMPFLSHPPFQPFYVP